MSTLLTNVGLVFTQCITWVQTIATFIVGGTVGSGDSAVTYASQPLLLVFVIVPLVFLGINMFRKLLSL